MSAPIPDGHLSDREIQILTLAARGLTDERIAARLTISRHTTKSHLRRIMDRLGARSRTHAVAIAYERRLLRTRWDADHAVKLTALRELAEKWSALPGATGREAGLADAGRALLTILNGTAAPQPRGASRNTAAQTPAVATGSAADAEAA